MCVQYQSSCAPKLARVNIGFPVVRTDGRAVYGHVITKFSGMGRFTYPWCSAGALRTPELRYHSIFRTIEALVGFSRKPLKTFSKSSIQAAGSDFCSASGGECLNEH